MSARFTVLASGSAGNASLLQVGDFGLLIDFGLGSRTLGKRLAARGFSWHSVSAVLLTHTHSDHWNETSLAMIANHGAPVYCHDDHAEELAVVSSGFARAHEAGRIHRYVPGQWQVVGPGLRVLPIDVSHDCDATCGFRIEGPEGLFGASWAIGYIADLGTWNPELALAFADVDLLALEFNHDETMQRTSGRPRMLIDRVLGDYGHLSNRQAKAFVHACREASALQCLRYLVTLHRSQQCNTSELVQEAAREIIGEACIEIIQAEQHEPTRTLVIGQTLFEAPAYQRTSRRTRAVTNGFFDEKT